MAAASNDDKWNSAQADQVAAESPAVGAFPLPAYSNDAVIFTRVSPGLYSAIIEASDSETGVALAEIYEANAP